MKALAIVALSAGIASAAPIVQPPAGWTGGANAELVQQTGGEGHFGGVHGVVEAERWDPPKPGVVLYATRVAATTSARDAAAAAEIDQLHRKNEAGWHVATADKATEVMLTWKDSGVHGDVRMLVTGSGDAVIVATKGECVAADDAPKDELDACKAALATLDPAIAVNNRAEIGRSPPATPAPAPTPTMSDGSKMPPPPETKQEAAPADRRPLYVGAGVILLATAYFWNRRRRERFEREEKVG